MTDEEKQEIDTIVFSKLYSVKQKLYETDMQSLYLIRNQLSLKNRLAKVKCGLQKRIFELKYNDENELKNAKINAKIHIFGKGALSVTLFASAIAFAVNGNTYAVQTLASTVALILGTETAFSCVKTQSNSIRSREDKRFLEKDRKALLECEIEVVYSSKLLSLVETIIKEKQNTLEK